MAGLGRTASAGGSPRAPCSPGCSSNGRGEMGPPPAGREPSGRQESPGSPQAKGGAEPHSQCPASCGTSAAGASAAAWGRGRPLLPELLQRHGGCAQRGVTVLL